MKIAAITIYCDEWFRLDDWIKHYSNYKDELYLHIIINNGLIDDNQKLSTCFPHSKVIYSESKNMIFCYNLGVKEAFSHPEIDAIMQVTNDVKFERGTLTQLYNQLMSDSTLAVIGPVMLRKDSQIIESFGYIIEKFYGDSTALYSGKSFDDLNESFKYVSCVPGGAIMVKRNAYEDFGLQDENIHMYCDERDMYIRFSKLGYKEGVLCTAKAWHQHVFKPGTATRSTLASYLSARNRIYVTKKHNSSIIAFCEFFRLFIRYVYAYLIAVIRRNSYADFYMASIKGLLNGYMNNMTNVV
ncbi:MAG: glycosyltransferase family 2 protein [Alphaproteobacteria bacterium]|nr:glycosyltransferase family 2 protein [Alphaproteobacteria bacterium]MBQ6989393.1 glycosyltransferase family 2 protein [Alistipes sp.]